MVGTLRPSCSAALRIVVPAGTATESPSIVSLTSAITPLNFAKRQAHGAKRSTPAPCCLRSALCPLLFALCHLLQTAPAIASFRSKPPPRRSGRGRRATRRSSRRPRRISARGRRHEHVRKRPGRGFHTGEPCRAGRDSICRNFRRQRNGRFASAPRACPPYRRKP